MKEGKGRGPAQRSQCDEIVCETGDRAAASQRVCNGHALHSIDQIKNEIAVGSAGVETGEATKLLREVQHPDEHVEGALAWGVMMR